MGAKNRTNTKIDDFVFGLFLCAFKFTASSAKSTSFGMEWRYSD